VKRARQLNPGIEFAQGNMLSLDVVGGAWAGITAFYAIVNLPPDDLVPAMREMYRGLQPGGLLLLSFHIGEEIVHEDNLWGRKVCLDFYFFRSELVTDCLRSAGFVIEEIIEREPYAPDVEYQSRRAYIFAQKPMTKTISA
jgi:ubiquinone/menaquinone biosynthesis C-methylase UbiE